MSITLKSSKIVYEGWLTLHVASLAAEGGAAFRREIEDHGRAVAVLPYDPDRRVALLVELPRAPALFVGETELFLEAPAGLLEDGEPPETGARREAEEETGVSLAELELVCSAWSMPGISTERMELYLARYGAADRTGPGGGLVEEDENITVREVGLADLAARADRNALRDLKTFALLQALRIRRPELFA